MRADIASEMQLESVASWVKYMLPMCERAQLSQVSKYVEEVMECMGPGHSLHFPACSKDPTANSAP